MGILSTGKFSAGAFYREIVTNRIVDKVLGQHSEVVSLDVVTDVTNNVGKLDPLANIVTGPATLYKIRCWLLFAKQLDGVETRDLRRPIETVHALYRTDPCSYNSPSTWPPVSEWWATIYDKAAGREKGTLRVTTSPSVRESSRPNG